MEQPCCEYHANQDICTTCQCAIGTKETRYYGTKLMAKQTFWSPAGYECEGPFCGSCWDEQIQRAERDEEWRSLRGLDTERI